MAIAYPIVKRFPRIVAAQRLQTLLLVTALVAVLLGCLLMSDLVRNFQSVVVADATKSLANALRELTEAEKESSNKRTSSLSPDALDLALRAVSYEVLRSYPDVEGGSYLDDQAIGHGFPSYTEPVSALKQPQIERNAVLDCLAQSRLSGEVGRRCLLTARIWWSCRRWQRQAALLRFGAEAIHRFQLFEPSGPGVRLPPPLGGSIRSHTAKDTSRSSALWKLSFSRRRWPKQRGTN